VGSIFVKIGGPALALSLLLSASGTLCALAPFGPQAALAADANATGMKFFKAKDYGHAAGAFKQAIAQNPNDSTRYYYYALSLHYAKQTAAAKIAYLEILTRFPSSPSASYAQAALASLDPSLMKQMAASPRLQQYGGSAGGGSYGGSGGGDTIPAETLVNFNLENNHMIIDISFSGRRTKAIFDTGAETILMGKNHLRELGLPMPTGAVTSQSRGVDGTLTDLQEERMDVTVGGITRRNIVVHIAEKMDSLPLLGMPFLKGLSYSFDTNTIRLTNKSATASSGSIYRSSGTDYNSVPYTMQGRSIVVQAQVNGHNVPMCLDTGAAETLFNKPQAASAGLRVAEDAETVMASGAGGLVSIKYTTISSIRLGPVERRDFKVGVNEASHSPYPLLGRDFFGDRRFSVDDANHVIHFN